MALKPDNPNNPKNIGQ